MPSAVGGSGRGVGGATKSRVFEAARTTESGSRGTTSRMDRSALGSACTATRWLWAVVWLFTSRDNLRSVSFLDGAADMRVVVGGGVIMGRGNGVDGPAGGEIGAGASRGGVIRRWGDGLSGNAGGENGAGAGRSGVWDGIGGSIVGGEDGAAASEGAGVGAVGVRGGASRGGASGGGANCSMDSGRRCKQICKHRCCRGGSRSRGGLAPLGSSPSAFPCACGGGTA